MTTALIVQAVLVTVAKAIAVVGIALCAVARVVILAGALSGRATMLWPDDLVSGGEGRRAGRLEERPAHN